MILNKTSHHWVPTGFHGSIAYTGSDVATAIEQAINQATKRMPATLRPPLTEAKYLIEQRSDGTLLLIFEVS